MQFNVLDLLDDKKAKLILADTGDVLEHKKDMSLLAKQRLGKFTVGYDIPEVLIDKDARTGLRTMIVPESHIKGKNIRTRIDYVTEIKDIMEVLFDVVKTIKPDYTIFLGEIFDGNMGEVKELFYWLEYFTEMKEYTEVVTVKGNHEDTYYQNNPFWYMAEGCGLTGMGLIKLYDTLDLGSVGITFEHFGLPVKRDTSGKEYKIKMGLMHEDLLTTSLRDYLDPEGEKYWWSKANVGQTLAMFPHYDVVYNGHMHRLHKRLFIPRKMSPLMLVYGGSIGRTNEKEVSNDFLYRGLDVYDTTEDTVVMNTVGLTLPCYEECINLTAVNTYREEYRAQKERKEVNSKHVFATLQTSGDRDSLLEQKFEEDRSLGTMYHYIKNNSSAVILECMLQRYEEGIATLDRQGGTLIE